MKVERIVERIRRLAFAFAVAGALAFLAAMFVDPMIRAVFVCIGVLSLLLSMIAGAITWKPGAFSKSHRDRQAAESRGDTLRYTCPNCGYDLQGTEGIMCPECGMVRPADVDGAREDHR